MLHHASRNSAITYCNASQLILVKGKVKEGAWSEFRSPTVDFSRHAEAWCELRNVHFKRSCSLLTSEARWDRSSSVRSLQSSACFFSTRTKQKLCVKVVISHN